jgi:hypothetical protein
MPHARSRRLRRPIEQQIEKSPADCGHRRRRGSLLAGAGPSQSGKNL